MMDFLMEGRSHTYMQVYRKENLMACLGNLIEPPLFSGRQCILTS